jgi:hypothetical protein
VSHPDPVAATSAPADSTSSASAPTPSSDNPAVCAADEGAGTVGGGGTVGGEGAPASVSGKEAMRALMRRKRAEMSFAKQG